MHLIRAEPPLERKKILDAVVQIAKAAAEGATLPSKGYGEVDPDGIQSRTAVGNASYVLGELGDEKAILEAFAGTFARIDVSVRTGVAYALAKCRNPIALELIEESAREQSEKMLAVDLSSLPKEEWSMVNNPAGDLVQFLEAMTMSANPAGEGKAREILDDLERRSVGHPLMDQVFSAIKDELEKKLARELNAAVKPSTSDPSAGNLVEREPRPLKGEDADAMGPMLKSPYFVYLLFGIAIFSVALFLVKAWNRKN